MTLRPTPWATSGGVDGKGGAENSVELARVGMYAALNGNTGIIEPKDFKVTQLPVPAGAVRVRSGTAGIVATYPGVFGQAYAVQETEYTDVPVAATGSGGSVTKYVYVRIDDSQFYGQAPADVKNGPYNSYQVTTSLPTIQPYLLLAKIVQPANTGTILNTMLTDLRELANPKTWIVDRSRPSVATDTGMKLSSTTGEWFPGDGAATGARQEMFCPAWATRMIVKPSWYGVRYDAGKNCYGTHWLSYGPSDGGGANGEPFLYKTQEFMFDSAGAAANAYRTPWLMSDDRAVGADMRGKMITFAFRAKRNAASPSNAVSMDGLSGLDLTVMFLQEPDRSTE